MTKLILPVRDAWSQTAILNLITGLGNVSIEWKRNRYMHTYNACHKQKLQGSGKFSV